MAARTPRRSFATPFVITLAAAPACYVQSTPPQQPQPVQSQPSQPAQPPDRPPVTVVNPPTPQTESATPPNQRWTVFKQPDGVCMATIKVQCKPGTMCNPPPPSKYACPNNVSLDKPVTVASSADGSACFVEYAAMACPPNVACNPPRPTPVACPKP